jgi:hypothetical protein
MNIRKGLSFDDLRMWLSMHTGVVLTLKIQGKFVVALLAREADGATVVATGETVDIAVWRVTERWVSEKSLHQFRIGETPTKRSL